MLNQKKIIAAVTFVGLVAHELWVWLTKNDGPAYFAEDWTRILMVAVFGIAGGLLAAGFMRLRKCVRQRLAEMLLLACLAALILGLGMMVRSLIILRETLASSAEWWLAAAAVAVVFASLVLLGISIRRSSQNHGTDGQPFGGGNDSA